jgi:hypothetical protein
MSKQLHTAISACLKLTDTKNEHSRSGDREDTHEDAISNILNQSGFTEIIQTTMGVNRNGKPKKVRVFKDLSRGSIKKALQSNDPQSELLKLVPDMTKGSYIRQPGGSQSFPDFLVRDFNGRIVLIEAKSGNGVCPTWNGGLPKKDAVYVFTSIGRKETTIFLGQDVISEVKEKLLSDFHDKLQAESKRLKEQLKELDAFDRGFDHYVRSKFGQGGGDKKVNYFTHADRARCEKNALSFVLGK